MTRIQIITITINLVFVFYISRLIVKGKLREEYAIVWCICTFFLVIFSFWSEGLNAVSQLFGVEVPANLVFTGFIFIILVYLLHLSVRNSRLQKNMTQISQEVALLKEEINHKLTQHSFPEPSDKPKTPNKEKNT